MKRIGFISEPDSNEFTYLFLLQTFVFTWFPLWQMYDSNGWAFVPGPFFWVDFFKISL